MLDQPVDVRGLGLSVVAGRQRRHDARSTFPLPKPTPDTSNGQTAPGKPRRRAAARADSAARAAATPVDTPATPRRATATRTGWIVSFAAFVSEAPAREACSGDLRRRTAGTRRQRADERHDGLPRHSRTVSDEGRRGAHWPRVARVILGLRRQPLTDQAVGEFESLWEAAGSRVAGALDGASAVVVARPRPDRDGVGGAWASAGRRRRIDAWPSGI